ncbi:unnamed protein product, partial [Brachionus calyciflorus]
IEPIESDVNAASKKFNRKCFYCKLSGHKKSEWFKWTKEKKTNHRGYFYFDGGTTNTFIKLDRLTSNAQKVIREFRSGNRYSINGLIKIPLNIKSATNVVSEECVIAKMKISINGWSCVQNFIVTDNLVDKDIILDRDFLKKLNY